MKKLILILGFVITSLIGYSQATAVSERRVATTSTVFGENLPVGTKIYCIADSTYWVLKAPAGAALTLATIAASDKFQLNKTAIDTDDQNLTWDATNGHIEISEGNDADVGSFGTANANYGFVIGSNGETTKFLRGDNTWQTVITTEVDGSVTNEGALTVGAGGANDSKIVSNTIGDKAVVISGGTGITITEADSTITIAYGGTVVRTDIVETFDVASAGSTYVAAISQTPADTTSISVSLNGMTLMNGASPNDNWDKTGTNDIRINLPVYQYDKVEVHYRY